MMDDGVCSEFFLEVGEEQTSPKTLLPVVMNMQLISHQPSASTCAAFRVNSRMATYEEDNCHDEMVQRECQIRREAELEFVSSAYTPEEAWYDRKDTTLTMIRRRLYLTSQHTDSTTIALPIELSLQQPNNYPISEPLMVVDVKLEPNINGHRNTETQKRALDAVPSLLETCRTIARDHVGEESVLVVLSAAEDWIHEEWPKLVNNHDEKQTKHEQPDQSLIEIQKETRVLGRRLIYSHHIIAKKKRADIKALVADYNLTGYMKIGWPGLLIVEGDEENCKKFYDEIRPWRWQYLVVRGEQKEQVTNGKNVEAMRCFSNFVEVDDMSVVADHCRQVGLESLFRTSMKQYQDFTEELEQPHGSTATTAWYGALGLVDHMNDGKGYRKWLRKCSREVGCFLFVKQIYREDDYTNRPMIYVGLIGDRNSVSAFLKRWRTSRVDVASNGKPCLERNLAVLKEGLLHLASAPSDFMDWDMAASEEKLTANKEDFVNVLSKFGWTLE
jgi:hypothetical protein